MQKILLVIGLLIVLGTGYWWSQKSLDTDKMESGQTMSAPARPAEITGTVVSVEGNEVILAKEIGREILTEAEQAAKQAERQKMSQEERQAAREVETAQYQTEEITLIIPVGVPIVQGTGDGSGAVALTDLGSLVKGTYLSVWTNSSGSVEYIKIKGL